MRRPHLAISEPQALWISLIREAGWRHASIQVALALMVSLLDVGGLGMAIALLFGRPGGSAGLPLQLSLPILLLVVVGRSALQGLATVRRDQLQNDFSDRLRRDLLALVLVAPANQLQSVGRGDLLGLLVSDIGRSTLALDQGMRALQAAIALLIYSLGVLLVARDASLPLPLLLGLAAAALAALLRRSGAWQLGHLQTQLNGAIQRTVGDGLHGLKAVRAAGAESWLLDRGSPWRPVRCALCCSARCVGRSPTRSCAMAWPSRRWGCGCGWRRAASRIRRWPPPCCWSTGRRAHSAP